MQFLVSYLENPFFDEEFLPLYKGWSQHFINPHQQCLSELVLVLLQ